MSITAKQVMELRNRTGAGMMDCKKALLETSGDIEKGIVYLREKGISKAAKKASRIAAQGSIFAIVSDDFKTGALLEFNSETDFVAKNQDFQDLGKAMVSLILNNDISSIDELKKMEIAGKTVAESTIALIARIGENMNVRRFKKESSGGFIISYIHMDGKIGVLLNLEGEKTDDNLIKAKDIAMQIAAMDPAHLDRSDVTEEDLNKEKAILRAQLLEEGKPEQIIDKILIGKMNKFYEENCLLQQKFVKDDKMTVTDYLQGLIVSSYSRFRLGEGIAKKEEDFAAEVAAQMGK